jgi:tocopherol cyclase
MIDCGHEKKSILSGVSDNQWPFQGNNAGFSFLEPVPIRKAPMLTQLSQFLGSTLHPAMYHGHGRSAPYFEGWYYKLVSADENLKCAVIPGVFLGENGHAFIQVLDGVTGRSAYHTYPLDQFVASRKLLDVRIGRSRFTMDGITLDVDTAEGQAHGELRFLGLKPWPVTVTSPGIMGWYAWVPRMECYHGVLSFDHAIDGALALDGRTCDWTGGRGYIEKDWGQSFPAAWIWFQSNHFSTPDTCVTASVALIPWLGNVFRGFIVGLWHEGQLHRCATYIGAHTEQLEMTDSHVTWTMRDRHHRLELLAERAEGGLILGPTRMEMGKRVHETLRASVHVRLTRGTQVLYEGMGRHAGLEAHGDLDRLLGTSPSMDDRPSVRR